jgi:hypothetical protein
MQEEENLKGSGGGAQLSVTGFEAFAHRQEF